MFVRPSRGDQLDLHTLSACLLRAFELWLCNEEALPFGADLAESVSGDARLAATIASDRFPYTNS